MLNTIRIQSIILIINTSKGLIGEHTYVKTMIFNPTMKDT